MNIEKLTSESIYIIREGITALIESLMEKGELEGDVNKLIELEKELTQRYQLVKGI